LVAANTESPLIGPPVVNVLALNQSLSGLKPQDR
jgi:K+-transporting ATPase ATPase C chain